MNQVRPEMSQQPPKGNQGDQLAVRTQSGARYRELVRHEARIADLDGCMECGACAGNCPVNALTLTPGVGCASYIIQVWLKGKENASCGGSGCC